MAGKNNNRDICCSFCGRTNNEVKKLIAGDGVFICDQCIDLCSKILEEENGSGKKSKGQCKINLIKPMDMKKHLDDYVIGQDAAKKALCVAV